MCNRSDNDLLKRMLKRGNYVHFYLGYKKWPYPHAPPGAFFIVSAKRLAPIHRKEKIMGKKGVVGLFVLVLMSINMPVVLAGQGKPDCTHLSGICTWPCIPFLLDQVVSINGLNAQVWFSGAFCRVPNVLPLPDSCGKKYPQHWYGCFTSSGGWGSACNYDCDPPY